MAQPKTYLQLLSELGGAPTLAQVENIFFFYKADKLNQGFEGNTGSIDEPYAELIYKSLKEIETNFKTSSSFNRKMKIIDYKYRLDNWYRLEKDNWFNLFCIVWLL